MHTFGPTLRGAGAPLETRKICRESPPLVGLKKKRLAPVALTACLIILVLSYMIGAPGEIRTPDHLVRSQVLYPTELRARVLCCLPQRQQAHYIAVTAATGWPSTSRRLVRTRRRQTWTGFFPCSSWSLPSRGVPVAGGERDDSVHPRVWPLRGRRAAFRSAHREAGRNKEFEPGPPCFPTPRALLFEGALGVGGERGIRTLDEAINPILP